MLVVYPPIIFFMTFQTIVLSMFLKFYSMIDISIYCSIVGVHSYCIEVSHTNVAINNVAT